MPRRRETRAGGASSGPATAGQRALCFLHPLAGATGALHIAVASRITPSPPPEVVATVLRQLAARHPALATVFVVDEGEPRRRVVPGLVPELVDLDASSWDLAELDRRVADEAWRPFDLAAGPLMRVAVFRGSARGDLLLLCFHHLTVDFWSLALVARDLGALFARANGLAVELAPPSTQGIEDLLLEEAKSLSEPRLSELEGFWLEELAGPAPELELPADRPRPPAQSFRGSWASRRLGREAAEAVTATARSLGVTPFVFLLAAFDAWLFRVTGGRDLWVLTPTAGRSRRRLPAVVGYFVNPVVIRARVEAGEPFSALALRVKETTAAAIRHQDYPFSVLTARRGEHRHDGRAPLASVMFQLQRTPLGAAAALAGLAIGEPGVHFDFGPYHLESIPLEARGSQLDLTLRCAEIEGELVASFEYSTDLFDAVTLERFLDQVATLVPAICARPETPVGRLSLLSPAERAEVLGRGDGGPAGAPVEPVLPRLIAARAAERPEAVALVWGHGSGKVGEQWSYGELWARARLLACHLRARGIGPEDRVGVCLERTPQLIVSLLAVLEAGGAYVPLDPAYPAERLALMLEVSDARLVLGRSRTPLPAAVPVLDPASVLGTLPSGDLPPACRLDPENLAYVIFTSGSTGKPKGVAIPHGAAVELVRWAGETFGAEDWAGMVASTSVSFDLSVFEIFGTLAAGGTIILLANALELPHHAHDGRIRLLNTVPSVAAELVAGALPPGLATVALAGEALPPALVGRWLQRGTVTRVWNLYGPSEDTTYSTWEIAEPGGARVPIGRPISGTRARVRDGGLELVPGGVVGELFLSGRGLARGYLGDPRRTAERFLPDPDPATPGERTYATGDRVLCRADGRLDYLGRADAQVKIRGFRIEPGEVEAALLAEPEVEEALVAVREVDGRPDGLLAFVAVGSAAAGGSAPHGGSALRPDAAALAERLAERLPPYLMPGSWVVLERFPRTPSGKVDRRALLAQAATPAPAPAGEHHGPEGVLERYLSGLFAEVLGREGIDRETSFFDLGGHSLLAMRLLSRIQRDRGVEIPIDRLFAQPSVAALARLIEEGSPAQAAAGRREPSERLEAGPRLSLAQQRMWFLDRLQPGSDAYNMTIGLACRGPLALGLLAASLGDVVRRHELLRLAIVEREGEPVARLLPLTPPSWPLVDLSGLAAGHRGAESERLRGRSAGRPFDLARGPLLRQVALRRDPLDHDLLIDLHHVVGDGWSLGLLAHELMRCFAARASGSPAELPPLPLRYGEWVEGLEKRLAASEMAARVERVAERLRRAGAGEPLELPIDHPRRRAGRVRSPILPFRLGAAEAAALSRLGRRLGGTPFLLVLTLYFVLLARLSRQHRLTVGIPVAGRLDPRVEGLIGLFVNTVVVPADLGGQPTLAGLFAQVRDAALAAQGDQEVPFERVVEAVRPRRELDHSPLFQALLAWQNDGFPRLTLGATQVERLPLPPRRAKFDLSILLEEGADGWVGEVEADHGLFEATTALRLRSWWVALLTGVARLEAEGWNAERSLEALPWLSRAEQHQLLCEWNDTGLPASADQSLAAAFARQARATPEAAALVAGEVRLSYRDLHSAAVERAAVLAELGVGAEVPVAVLMPRTAELVVSLLAVLEAGGCYVPLDPAYPPARIEAILADTEPAVVVTTPELVAALPEGEEARLLVLPTGALELVPGRRAGARPALPGSGGESLAYVLFTSGSTGKPKGVAIRHRGALGRLEWARRAYRDEEMAGVLAGTSICFDLSVFEIFATLARGGKVILADNALALPGLAARDEVTLINTVPSAARELFLDGRLPAGLTNLNLAGEPLRRALAREVFAARPELRLDNLYGPSEDTTYSTGVTLLPGDEREPSIGRPLPGSRAHLLDERLAPVPIGVVGEVCLGGIGLARGYYRQPRSTAAAFVPDPFGPEPGGRLYRTGDLGRFRPDGTIELVGRRDQQVKLRGFRIELTEIEAQLALHPAVADVAVLVDRRGEDARLVAFCEVRPGVGWEPAVLAEHLGRRLPAYMVPAVFVHLEQMPRTATGKIDRKALPAPSAEATPARPAQVPQGGLEARLAALWCEVLGRAEVGLEESFFELGGHSLSATRLLSRIREGLGVDLPLKSLFEAPTVARLARVIGGLGDETGMDPRSRGDDGGEEVSSARHSRESGSPGWGADAESTEAELIIPLSYAQRRLWFFDRLWPGSPLYNIPAALDLDGRLDGQALASALGEIVRRHQPLRSLLVEGATGVFLRVAPPRRRPLPLPRVDLSALGGEVRRALADALTAAEAARPFDLDHQPPLRGRLLVLGPEAHRLLLTQHHLAADGWSVGLLLSELLVLYPAVRDGKPSPLPEPSSSWAEHVAAEEASLTPEAVAAELAFWRAELGVGTEMAAPLELPTDRPRPALPSLRGELGSFSLPAALGDAVGRFAQGAGATPFMAFLAGFEAVAARWSGQRRYVLGTPVAGRHRVETEGLIGVFINTLPLLAELEGAPSLVELVSRVRRRTLAAFSHQQVSFDRLIEELHPERDLSRAPLFQVVFSLQSRGFMAPAGDLTTGFGPSLAAVASHTGTAKLDLAITCVEGVGEGLGVEVEWASDLFDRATVERLVGHWARLLEAAVAEPGRPVTELAMISPEERRQLIWGWNDTAAQVPFAGWTHELVVAQGAERPDAVAVGREGEIWTYGHLLRRSAALARGLRELGVGPDVRVVVLAERTRPERILGSLAVMLAGGAYVPLDPAYPPERLAYLFTDAGAEVILTQEDLLDRLPATEAQVLCLDTVLPEGHPEERRGQGSLGRVDGANLAYVVYTSGSTGKPKGVEIPHEGLLHMVRWHQDYYGVRAVDRATQVASPAFDASVWELWPYLAAGASVHIPEEETRLSAAGTIDWWERERLTLVYLPTALVEGVLREPIAPERTIGVRTVIIGGDRLVGRPAPDAPFVLSNTYGPAEYTVLSTAVPVAPRGAAAAVGLPSIGLAITNTQLYVLDTAFQPAPLGVPGELVIGGVGLARGYLGRPGLTAWRFVPDPFSGRPGARLYRSGDRVRRRPDGDFDFLGRSDFQIKLRGFRIEPGEIESALAEHPAVRDAAVVLAREGGREVLVAYLTAREAGGIDAEALRRHARSRLPEYMVPAAFVTLDRLPFSPNGKVDRSALERLPRPELASGRPAVAPASELETRIAALWADLLGLDQVGVEESFFDLGGHSMLVARMHQRLRDELGAKLPLVELFQLPTVRALAERLAPEAAAGRRSGRPAGARRERAATGSEGIAIIGMAGRFPGAGSVEALWRNLLGGVESIAFFSREELLAAGVSAAEADHPRYVPANGALDDADRFDAAFFGYNPREAQLMDPQQRLFLETCWQALEDAGYGAERDRGEVGLFAGATFSSYLLNLISQRELVASFGSRAALIGNDKDHVPNRVSYKLNLRGPSMSVQSACSTSLVAVHVACRSLARGECDLALAGGVCVSAPLRQGYLFEEGGVMSPDGHCRAFDAEARGTVGGQGVAAVVLKPLARAVADGDPIYAVIRGSAVNNDGSAKVGYTSPSIDGQTAVIVDAQEEAGFAPETLGFVEAHGTGTAVGDPIEVTALTRAFRRGTDARGFCALGSVKPNLGHLDSAAGVAGLIKAALAVARGTVPPTLHFKAPNPDLELEESPFFVNAAPIPWPLAEGPRRAGVSSLGIGGTNAHVVLEQAPPPAPSAPGAPWQLLTLSAKTPGALDRLSDALARHLGSLAGAEPPEVPLADVAWTLLAGRQRLPHRRTLVARDLADGARRLAERDLLERHEEGTRRPVTFLFPGFGPHHVGMSRSLYRSDAGYRHDVDRASEVLAAATGRDPRTVIDPPADTLEAAERAFVDPAVHLPALFVVELCLARLWQRWGVTPRALLGHSNGELVAACLAGVFSEADALRLVARRAELIGELPATGAMLSIPCTPERAAELLAEHPELDLAVVNGPELVVLTGPAAAMDELEARLVAEGLAPRRLRIERSPHSRALRAMAPRLAAAVAGLERQAPQLPWVSNLTGTWITLEQAIDPGYWGDHLCSPVRFSACLATLAAEDPTAAFLEVGPGGTLSGLVRSQYPERLVASSLPGVKDPEEDLEVLLRTAGRLWLAGAELDPEGLQGGVRRRRLHLPVYPFAGPRFWVEPGRTAATVGALERLPVEDWTWLPGWKLGRPARLLPALAGPATWLVGLDGCGVGERLAELLAAAGVDVLTFGRGGAGSRHRRLQPTDGEGWRGWLEELAAEGRWPRGIVYTAALTAAAEEGARAVTELPTFFAFHALARALAGFDGRPETLLLVAANRLQAVSPGEPVEPEKATLLGLLKVLTQEVEWLRCRSVDLAAADPATAARELFCELGLGAGEEIVALRSGQRWLRWHEAVRLPAPAAPVWRERGVYLLTGGLSPLGLALAERLARQARARLALVARRRLPPREEWPVLAARADGDGAAEAVRAVLALEAQGAEVLVISADVTRRGELARALDATRQAFGTLNGVFHLASVPAVGLIRQRSAAEAAAVLAPKLEGAWLLAELLAGSELDFLVLYSSLAGTIGGLAQGDYSAANAFLDAFAPVLAASTGLPVTAIDWGYWQLADVEAERRLQAGLSGELKARRESGMRPAEALDVLEKVISAGVPRVLVSTRDLEREIRTVEELRQAGEAEAGSRSGAVEARPNLDTPYVAPRDQLEESLCELWAELIGVAPVGIRDNFYELGGHSLLATQITSRMWDRYRVELPLDRMLAGPTVAELAAVVTELRAEQIDGERLAALLSEIEAEGAAEVGRSAS
ncbi:MAG TPA: amino acid adenylation domain-containing protein [Thermoanaerobaculia bacterium]|nr:amino acid adenylation domain-containing protein [Thermoanaerobaculia bacterium]